MFVTFLKYCPYALDGIKVVHGLEGETANLPDQLASDLVEAGFAEMSDPPSTEEEAASEKGGKEPGPGEEKLDESKPPSSGKGKNTKYER